MAIITIAHKPHLTKEQAQDIFARHFEGKYQVEPCDSPLSLKAAFRDFQVVKNPVVGVALKLRQTGTETQFVYGAVPPRRWTRTFFSGLWGYFFWRDLQREVEEFIRTAPEFN